jgi:hypothetical protein
MLRTTFGHDRSVEEVENTAIQEDAKVIAFDILSRRS